MYDEIQLLKKWQKEDRDIMRNIIDDTKDVININAKLIADNENLCKTLK